MGGIGCVGVKLNVVQKLWLCALACTSFNFTKRWLIVLCFVCLFILCRVFFGIGHNSLIPATPHFYIYQIITLTPPNSSYLINNHPLIIYQSSTSYKHFTDIFIHKSPRQIKLIIQLLLTNFTKPPIYFMKGIISSTKEVFSFKFFRKLSH